MQRIDQLINNYSPKDLTWKSPALFISLYLFSKYYPSSTKQLPYTTQDVVQVPFQNTTVSYQKFITTSEDVRIIRFKVDSEIPITDDQIFQVLSLEIHPSERPLYTLSKQWGKTIIVQREIRLSKPISPFTKVLKWARFVLGTLSVLYSGAYLKQVNDLAKFETDIHNFFLKRNQILENENLKQHYESVVLSLLDLPTNVKFNKSTYFVAGFIMECIQILNLEKDRNYLLLKAIDILNAGKYTTEMETSQKNALLVQISTALHDVEKMKQAFDIYFKFVRTQLVEYKKTKKPIQIALDDLAIGFSCAPHVGAYAEMALLGDLIVDVFNAPHVLEFFNDQANTEQQTDYSAIYKLLKAYPVPNEPIQSFDISKFKPISCVMKMQSMVCSINSEKEETIPNDFDPITLDSDQLLEIHQWGNVILWFQQIVLSGIIGDDKIFLYGYADIEGMDGKNNNNNNIPNSLLSQISQSITDEEMKTKITKLLEEGKETDAETVENCTLESQFQLESIEEDTTTTTTQDCEITHWKGIHKKTITEKRTSGDVVRIITTYSVDLSMVELK